MLNTGVGLQSVIIAILCKRVIRKKFLLKFVRNENPQQKRIRQQAVINKFQNKLNLLNVRAERHHTNCKNTDDEFSDFLGRNFEGDIWKELTTMWRTEYKTEQNKREENGKRNRYDLRNTSKRE